jgi:hypothetical protein
MGSSAVMRAEAGVSGGGSQLRFVGVFGFGGDVTSAHHAPRDS